MSIRRIAVAPVVVALISVVTSASPARATHELVRGYVTDGVTGRALSGVCVSISPPGCTQLTSEAGTYQIHFAHGTQTAELHFSKAGYQTMSSGTFTVGGHLEFSQVLMPVGERELCPSPRAGTPTQTVYLPNVMKLWWEAWQTPFIVQNTGATDTTLEITFYRFLNGSCAVRRTVTGLRPGASLADVPNNDTDVPRFTQFSVVIRSFGSTIVSVVNEQAPFGPRDESLSYVGSSTGATSVFLPNVTRRFFNWVTPIVIQNLGSTEADVMVTFTSFDGTAPDATATRRIPAGASKFVDPNYEPGLVDGKQYTARVTSAQPVSVVVNAHSGLPRNTVPVGYAMNGVTAGADTVYGPYAAKNGGSQRWVSTIVVHNLSQSTIRPSLQFDPLGGGGSPHTLTAPTTVGPGRAWAFDPRFTLGTTTPCAMPSGTCLGDGEYSVIARSNDASAQIAVALNFHADGAAMGYTAIPAPASKTHLPNVTRRLGGASGWTTPILLQALGTAATGAMLRWHRFSDGALVHTQAVAIRSGSAVRIDPRDVPDLQDDTQYSVVVEGVGGTIAAIVTQLRASGDDAMIYEGFASAP
jgi:hypothetical protein